MICVFTADIIHHASKHHTQARKPQSLRTGTQAIRLSKGWGKLELTAAGVQVQGKRAKPGSSGERAELVILGQKRRSQRPFAKQGLSPEVVSQTFRETSEKEDFLIPGHHAVV